VIVKRHPLPDISADLKRTWKRIRRDYSAGGVAYRRCPSTEGMRMDSTDMGGMQSGEWEIALIATRGGKRWQLPKGSREADESPLETAIREVKEEAGLQTVCEAFLQSIDYWYWDTYRKIVPELVHKTVDFYLLRVVGGALTDQCYEVDAAEWFTFDRAQQIMTFEGEVEVVRRALAALEKAGV
jgi:8-oxo-dGTP pyrophosphatase MutT (NUDIX family)